MLHTHSALQPGARKKQPLFLYGALLGALVFLLLYGPSTLNPTYDSWIRCGYVEEDIIQHYAAWQYYRYSDWHFPLTWLDNLSQPLGAAAAWGDPLPWAAVFFKLLSPILPETFQYFGLVTLLHFMLQGAFAWLLIQLFDQRISICLPGTLLLCCWPVMLERVFRHTSLSAQWLVLAMLYLYFSARHSKIRWPLWALLFLILPGIHAYFMPMAFGLLCASLLEHLLFRHTSWWWVLGVPGCLALSLVSARALGVLMPNMGADSSGLDFGRYSMNLNAPFNPSSMDLYHADETLPWSQMLPILPQNHHQYDGFNYLGAGVLLALAGILVYGLVLAIRRGFGRSLRAAGQFALQHCGLLIACAAFTLFSASNKMFWGTHPVLSFSLPKAVESVFSIFRASGRIFWPVGYLLALSVIVVLAHVRKDLPRMRCSWGSLLLCLVLLVQLADLSGVLLYKHQHFAQGPLTDTHDYETEKARQLFAGTDEVLCLGNIFDYRLAECMIRSNHEIQTNLVMFGRGNYNETFATYATYTEALLSGAPIDENVLYVATEWSYCEEVFRSGHPDIAVWQLEQLYLFGVPTADRPAPDFTRENPTGV